jgi:hypothetical protein
MPMQSFIDVVVTFSIRVRRQLYCEAEAMEGKACSAL